MVGIIKQENKSSLETKEVVVNFTEKPKMHRRGSSFYSDSDEDRLSASSNSSVSQNSILSLQ